MLNMKKSLKTIRFMYSLGIIRMRVRGSLTCLARRHLRIVNWSVIVLGLFHILRLVILSMFCCFRDLIGYNYEVGAIVFFILLYN